MLGDNGGQSTPSSEISQAAPDGGASRSGDTPSPAGPRHRRPARPARTRRRLAVLAGTCVFVWMAVLSAVAYALTRPTHAPVSAPAGHEGPGAPNHSPPLPTWSTGIRSAKTPPSSSASANARPTPTPTPTPTPVTTRSTKAHAGVAHHGAPPSATPRWQTRVVRATYVLDPGDSVSTNRISLSLQTDGDLVLRDEHGRITWSTGTHAQGTHVVFQADGNFVLYRGDQTLWSSRTDGHDGAVLVLRADGAMTIDDGDSTLWSTGS